MAAETYGYNLSYKLNFVPGLIIISALYVMVLVLPSTSKATGYVTVSVILCIFLVLLYRERKSVSKNICVSDRNISATYMLSDEVSINWGDVESLRYTGKGLFLASWKLEKYLYAEIVSTCGKKIVIRRELQGYQELINTIESYTGKTFVAS